MCKKNLACDPRALYRSIRARLGVFVFLEHTAALKASFKLTVYKRETFASRRMSHKYVMDVRNSTYFRAALQKERRDERVFEFSSKNVRWAFSAFNIYEIFSKKRIRTFCYALRANLNFPLKCHYFPDFKMITHVVKFRHSSRAHLTDEWTYQAVDFGIRHVVRFLGSYL